jgi:hypothetical protein
MKALTIPLIVAIALLSLSQFTWGATDLLDCDWNRTCSGTYLTRNAVCTIDGEDYIMNESILCDYGCDSRLIQCHPPRMQQYAFIGGLIIVMILVLGWGVKKMR